MNILRDVLKRGVWVLIGSSIVCVATALFSITSRLNRSRQAPAALPVKPMAPLSVLTGRVLPSAFNQ